MNHLGILLAKKKQPRPKTVPYRPRTDRQTHRHTDRQTHTEEVNKNCFRFSFERAVRHMSADFINCHGMRYCFN